jgi:hypothetical protein
MTTTTSHSQEDISANSSPIYTLFDVETTDRLTRDHILRLAVGVVGAVLIKGFSSRQDCADTMQALENCEIGLRRAAHITPDRQARASRLRFLRDASARRALLAPCR